MARGSLSSAPLLRYGISLCALLVALFAVGCGGDEAPATKYQIAIATPTDGPLAARGRDMLDAARLALDSIDNQTGTVGLSIEPSRNATNDTLASIAALEQIDSEGSLTIDLSPPTGFEGFENRIWLLPSAEANGEAIAQFAAAGAPRSIDPVGGESKFDDAVARGVEAVVDRSGLSSGSSGDPVSGLEYSGAMVDDRFIVADNPMVPGVPQFTYVSPALSRDNYPPAGLRFFDAFIKEYDRVPDRFAIFAYEAVGLVVDAIRRLEDADEAVTPDSVQRSAFAIKDRFSPVGHYDVLPSGATTLYVFQARGKDSPPPESALIEVRR